MLLQQAFACGRLRFIDRKNPPDGQVIHHRNHEPLPGTAHLVFLCFTQIREASILESIGTVFALKWNPAQFWDTYRQRTTALFLASGLVKAGGREISYAFSTCTDAIMPPNISRLYHAPVATHVTNAHDPLPTGGNAHAPRHGSSQPEGRPWSTAHTQYQISRFASAEQKRPRRRFPDWNDIRPLIREANRENGLVSEFNDHQNRVAGSSLVAWLRHLYPGQTSLNLLFLCSGGGESDAYFVTRLAQSGMTVNHALALDTCFQEGTPAFLEVLQDNGLIHQANAFNNLEHLNQHLARSGERAPIHGVISVHPQFSFTADRNARETEQQEMLSLRLNSAHGSAQLEKMYAELGYLSNRHLGSDTPLFTFSKDFTGEVSLNRNSPWTANEARLRYGREVEKSQQALSNDLFPPDQPKWRRQGGRR
ncbi:hypothetical protein EGT07_01815 [Herbaspirillum sp. HC18]|nr:hypothetical protein EGT07_01815 [Herbaspirillum sp. HC18]